MAHGYRLSGLDTSFINLETGPVHMHVASTTLFEGPAPGYEEFRDHIASRLHLVPRFRQKLRFVPFGQGRPVWVDDPQFNLDYHVRHTALPSPGSEAQLRTLAARIFSQRLDRSKPVWEMWLVDGLEGGRFAIVGKTHHCLVDGVSGVDITTVLFDLDREPSEPSSPEPWLPKPEPSSAQLLGEAILERATNPVEMIRGARALVAAARAERPDLTIVARARALVGAPGRAADAIVRELGGAGAFLRTGFGAPRSPINRSIGPYRRFAWVRTDLNDLKRVKNLAGGTVNDAVITAVAGGLGRFLRGRGHGTAGFELRAMVPISVRTADEHGALGNRVSAMMAPLPVGRRDPIDRLHAVSGTMSHLKKSSQAVGASLLTDVTNFTPPTIAAQAARLQSYQRFFNTVVTNVPGPQFPLYLLGRELLDIFPMVPLAANQAITPSSRLARPGT